MFTEEKPARHKDKRDEKEKAANGLLAAYYLVIYLHGAMRLK
ncbi:hypothetical protein PESP_a2091 [Pseudoalteromonas espejiana DSM 9414]|nr:hypothetical protein PESP_a2091 [Pseudoalteromonas espejiana DSM 9414]